MGKENEEYTAREALIDFSKYEIRENGTIFSKHFKRELDGTLTDDGYNRVCMKDIHGDFNKYLTNRVIYTFFNGEIPEGMEVNHKDENKLNNSIDNLNLLSHIDNSNWGTRNERISSTHHLNKKCAGRIVSDETRNKISRSQKERLSKFEEASKCFKKRWIYDDDFNLVKVCDSNKECAEYLGVSVGSVSSAAKGKRNRDGNHKIGDKYIYDAQL